ncbi:MAG: hypothetical protein OXC13_17935 [Caldilineaceae bacterium]|nr:hypothetical protein [Caldilineaceae bacterium]
MNTFKPVVRTVSRIRGALGRDGWTGWEAGNVAASGQHVDGQQTGQELP